MCVASTGSVSSQVVERVEGCDIDWYDGRNITIKKVKKKQNKKNQKKTITKTVQQESFFNIFKNLEINEEEANKDEAD